MQPATMSVFRFWGISTRYLLVLFLAFLMPVVGYLVLPALGFGLFKQIFQLNQLLMLSGAVIGGAFYLNYLQYIQTRPQLLIALMILGWPIIAYLNGLLLDAGINIRLTPLLLLLIAIPSLWLSIRNGAIVFQAMPWIKLYGFFVLWLALYALFFNANMVDPRLSGGEAALSEGSVSLIQTLSYVYCLLGMMISAITILKARQPKALFDVFNKALILVSSIESMITILGFPFGLFNMELDGFTRALGLFGHPNPYAHHMGVLMVYFLGLFCYYQGNRSYRLPGWLLFLGLMLNGVAFLLGLSKTAIAVLCLCATLLLLLNLGVPAVRQGFLKMAIGAMVLVPMGLLGFQVFTGNSFISLLESRIEQTQSLSWRTLVWQELMNNITLASVWFGHGLSAANEVVFRATYSDAKNAKPLMMVHNAYLALIYDLGLLGYLMFASALALIWQALKGCVNTVQGWRTEASIILVLMIYFLLVCGFDEMSYMFDAARLVWMLCAILFGLGLRRQMENGMLGGNIR